jgi:hypothetical protein
MFNKLLQIVCILDEYFVQCKDALQNMGLSPFQKCIIVIHIFTYEIIIDATYRYCRIRENTTMECL